MMLKRAVEQNPGCDGIVLGGHGLFTWGETSRDCYRRTLAVIDHLGQFVLDHLARKQRVLFGEEFTFSITLENAKLLPLPWLEIEEAIARSLAFSSRNARMPWRAIATISPRS